MGTIALLVFSTCSFLIDNSTNINKKLKYIKGELETIQKYNKNK